MNVALKITCSMWGEIRDDLARPHAYAAERVGFLSCATASLTKGLLLLGIEYWLVQDGGYVDDRSVGAMLSERALRDALQLAYTSQRAVIHIHQHDHQGRPQFSAIDKRETEKFMPDFGKVSRGQAHGAVVMSKDDAVGRCWAPGLASPQPLTPITIVGSPLRVFRA